MLDNRVKNSTKILIYMMLISIIYQSGSVRAALLGEGMLFKITRVVLLIAPLICMIGSGLKVNVIRMGIKLFLLGIGIALINYLLYPTGIVQICYKIIIMILYCCCFGNLSDKSIDLRKYMYQILIGLATVTLVFYILVELLKFPIPYSIVYSGTSYQYRDYFEIFFSYHYTFDIPRLSGLFWEPGAYQIYLNLALFHYVFSEEKKKWHLLIILLNIIFVQSAAGYCICVFLLVILLIKSNVFTKKSKLYLMLGGGGMASVIAVAVILKKIKDTGSLQNGSYTLRVADVFNGLNIFLNHIFVGVGFGNEELFKAADVFGRGSSNGLISYIYMTGIVGITFIIYPFVKNLMKDSNKVKQMCWLILLLLFNTVEPIYNLPIMAFYVGVEYAYALKKIKMRK